MKRLLVLLIVVCPALAIAQAPPPPPPPPGGPMGGGGAPPGAPGALPGVGTTWLGGGVELNMAGGYTDSTGMGTTVNGDLTSSFGLNAILEYQVSDTLAVGLMPRYLFGFRDTNAQNTDNFSMLDLRARVSAGTMVAPQVRGYGFGALGYSIIYPPSNVTCTNPDGTTGSCPNSDGMTLTFGAGINYSMNPRTRLYFEGSYELGFQSITVSGTSFDNKVNYLALGAGIQVAIGG